MRWNWTVIWCAVLDGSVLLLTLRQGMCESPLLLGDGAPANKVVANIPCNITGPLLERLIGRLDHRCPVQPPGAVGAEGGHERIRARPGSSTFSALSVRMQLLAHCVGLRCAAPLFQPPPKVQSEVIQLDPRPVEQQLAPPLARLVESLLKQAFLARRKMLRNTLGSVLPESQLQQLAQEIGISLQQRRRGSHRSNGSLWPGV